MSDSLRYLRNIVRSLSYAIPYGEQTGISPEVDKDLSRVVGSTASQVYGLDDQGQPALGKAPGLYYSVKALPTMVPMGLEALAAIHGKQWGMKDYAAAERRLAELAEKHMPDWATEADEKEGAIAEATRKGMGVAPAQGVKEHALDAFGTMLGQLPVPGGALKRLKEGSKLGKVANRVLGSSAEWLFPTIRPSGANYAAGTAFGTAIGEAPEVIQKYQDMKAEDEQKRQTEDRVKKEISDYLTSVGEGDGQKTRWADGGKIQLNDPYLTGYVPRNLGGIPGGDPSAPVPGNTNVQNTQPPVDIRSPLGSIDWNHYGEGPEHQFFDWSKLPALPPMSNAPASSGSSNVGANVAGGLGLAGWIKNASDVIKTGRNIKNLYDRVTGTGNLPPPTSSMPDPNVVSQSPIGDPTVNPPDITVDEDGTIHQNSPSSTDALSDTGLTGALGAASGLGALTAPAGSVVVSELGAEGAGGALGAATGAGAAEAGVGSAGASTGAGSALGSAASAMPWISGILAAYGVLDTIGQHHTEQEDRDLNHYRAGPPPVASNDQLMQDYIAHANAAVPGEGDRWKAWLDQHPDIWNQALTSQDAFTNFMLRYQPGYFGSAGGPSDEASAGNGLGVGIPHTGNAGGTEPKFGDIDFTYGIGDLGPLSQYINGGG